MRLVWILSLGIVKSCWQAHLLSLEGGTSPFLGSTSICFVYMDSWKGRGRGGRGMTCPLCHYAGSAYENWDQWQGSIVKKYWKELVSSKCQWTPVCTKQPRPTDKFEIETLSMLELWRLEACWELVSRLIRQPHLLLRLSPELRSQTKLKSRFDNKPTNST